MFGFLTVTKTEKARDVIDNLVVKFGDMPVTTPDRTPGMNITRYPRQPIEYKNVVLKPEVEAIIGPHCCVLAFETNNRTEAAAEVAKILEENGFTATIAHDPFVGFPTGVISMIKSDVLEGSVIQFQPFPAPTPPPPPMTRPYASQNPED